MTPTSGKNFDFDGTPELIVEGGEGDPEFGVLCIKHGVVAAADNVDSEDAYRCLVLWNNKTGNTVLAWIWDIENSNDWPMGFIRTLPDVASGDCFLFDEALELTDMSLWDGETIPGDEFARRWDAFWSEWEELGTLSLSASVREAYWNYGSMNNVRIIKPGPAKQKMEEIREYFSKLGKWFDE